MARLFRIGFPGALYLLISKASREENGGMSVDFSRCSISRCATWCSLLESSRSANVFPS